VYICIFCHVIRPTRSIESMRKFMRSSFRMKSKMLIASKDFAGIEQWPLKAVETSPSSVL